MAAHAGVLSFDRHLDASEATGLLHALEPMSPDGAVALFAERGLAMARAAFDVWAGDRSSRGIWRSAAGITVAWDGRLDNRRDLLLRLGGADRDVASDAALAAAAFERWGVDGLHALVGEWSAAIWDTTRRTLHLARDYMGVRPLYLVVTERSLAWSSDLGELATRTGRADLLSDRFAAGFMVLRVASDVTPFVGLRAVPAGCAVSFGEDGGELARRFWRLEPALVRYRDPRHYEDHLRALWTDAVASRLRTAGPPWAELSGGLDSSSVVCTADALMKSGVAGASSPQPISHVTLHSPEGDERRFIAAVEAQTGTSSHILGVEEHLECIDERFDWITPFAVRGVALAGLEHVRRSGGRVLLSGRAGDAVMGCESDNSGALFDDLAAGRPLAALAGLRRWSRSCRKPALEIAASLAGRATRFGIAAAARRGAAPDASGLALLTAPLRAMADFDNAALVDLLALVRRAKLQMAAMVLGYGAESRLNIPYTPHGVVHTYPFMHRPLVELMLAIPGDQLSAPGEMRALMRRAFAGLVPDRVLQRTSKGYYPPSAMRAARPLAAALGPVDRLVVVRRGWIEPAALDAAVRLLVDGGSTGGEVRRALRLEHWLLSRERRAPAAIPQRKEVRSHEVLNA